MEMRKFREQSPNIYDSAVNKFERDNWCSPVWSVVSLTIIRVVLYT